MKPIFLLGLLVFLFCAFSQDSLPAKITEVIVTKDPWQAEHQTEIKLPQHTPFYAKVFWEFATDADYGKWKGKEYSMLLNVQVPDSVGGSAIFTTQKVLGPKNVTCFEVTKEEKEASFDVECVLILEKDRIRFQQNQCFLYKMASVTQEASYGGFRDYYRYKISRKKILAPEDIYLNGILEQVISDYAPPVDSSPSPFRIHFFPGKKSVSSEGDEQWLEIGIQSRQNRNPPLVNLNLICLVDVSGSMNEPGAGGSKIQCLRNGLHLMIRTFLSEKKRQVSLSEKERQVSLTLIAFNEQTKTVLSDVSVDEKNEDMILKKIGEISASGQTNFYGALQQGFRSMRKSYKQGAQNRLLLFSDGKPYLSPEVLARIKKQEGWRGNLNNASDILNLARQETGSLEQEKGMVYLSVVGVGLDLNSELMQNLAREGKSDYFYVTDDRSIGETFVQVMGKFFQVLCKDISIQLQFPIPGTQVLEMIGYGSEGAIQRTDSIAFTIGNLLYDDKETYLIRVKTPKIEAQKLDEDAILLKAIVQYTDVEKNSLVKMDPISYQVKISKGLSASLYPSDPRVIQSLLAFKTAWTLREASTLFHSRRYEESLRLLEMGIEQVRDESRNIGITKDIRENCKDLVDYKKIIQKASEEKESLDRQLKKMCCELGSRHWQLAKEKAIPLYLVKSRICGVPPRFMDKIYQDIPVFLQEQKFPGKCELIFQNALPVPAIYIQAEGIVESQELKLRFMLFSKTPSSVKLEGTFLVLMKLETIETLLGQDIYLFQKAF